MDISDEKLEQVIEEKVEERVRERLKQERRKIKKEVKQQMKDSEKVSKPEDNKMTRRKFLKLLGVGAGGLALSSSAVGLTWSKITPQSQGVSDIKSSTVADGAITSSKLSDSSVTKNKIAFPFNEEVKDIIGNALGRGLSYDDAAGIIEETRTGPNPYEAAQTFTESNLTVNTTNCGVSDGSIALTYNTWDITTASYQTSISTQDSSPKGLAWKSDGTKLYEIGYISGSIYEYDVSTAWDIT
ncbi:MAG: twin-arginine translocation signal domain-containing protein, partial [Candidatus Nanohalobium sp.]